MKRLKQHLILYSIIISELIGLIISIILSSYHSMTILESIGVYIVSGLVLGTFIIYPFILTICNCYFLINIRLFRLSRFFDVITMILGILYSFMVLLFYNIRFDANWLNVLSNSEVHTPIWTEAYLTIFVFLLIGFLGYFLLTYIPLEKMPPLIITLLISMMYLGVFEAICWIIQIFSMEYLLLCLFPLNCIIIAMKTLRFVIIEWKSIEESKKKVIKNKYLYYMNKWLMDSSRWPLSAFILMLPLLGIVVCILTLFNQQPHYFIKAYLNTSDWNLSTRVAPQNIYYDEHYLCTVAAGGHQKIVKPLRRGVRHGHEVIVNRQLCIANAFEQILEERVPNIHKHLRHFYDTYGFPVAKMIKSQVIADFIYIIMKPLEWLFLIVIYSLDVEPENRIAVQYLPKGEIKNVI